MSQTPHASTTTATTNVITTVARHVVLPEREAEFRAWARDIDADCRAFTGYLGKELVRSHGDVNPVFFSVFRFDNTRNLERWLNSEKRRRRLADPRSFFTGVSEVKSYEGVAFWLQPRGAATPVPSTARLSLLTFLTIWPMVHWIAPLVSGFVTTAWLSEMITVGVIVVLMSYVCMPLFDRFLSKWLYR